MSDTYYMSEDDLKEDLHKLLEEYKSELLLIFEDMERQFKEEDLHEIVVYGSEKESGNENLKKLHLNYSEEEKVLNEAYNDKKRNIYWQIDMLENELKYPDDKMTEQLAKEIEKKICELEDKKKPYENF